MTILDIKKDYLKLLSPLDLDLIISHILRKPREFILAHPEAQLTKIQETRCKELAKRRQNNEPLAYILEHKEFYGLNFKVNKHTLIPRPETELLVDLAAKNILQTKNQEPRTIIDVGTGSGNIIISLAKIILSCHPELDSGSKRCRNKFGMTNFNFIATDISKDALQVAKYNAKKNNVLEKISFLQGNLLEPVLNSKNYKLKAKSYLIVANLPYLSRKIYSKTLPDIKKFEPKSALLSKNNGLDHYDKLLKQIKQLKKNCYAPHVMCCVEFSPEQKKPLEKMIKKYFLGADIKFHKDLANKWRAVAIRDNLGT